MGKLFILKGKHKEKPEIFHELIIYEPDRLHETTV